MIKGVGHPAEITGSKPERGAEKGPAAQKGEEPRRPDEARPTGDRVTTGQKPLPETTYSRPSEVATGNFRLMRDLVARMLEEQGATFRITLDGAEVGFRDLTPEQARDLVSTEGYFGVEQTSQRIFESAIGLAGNDPSRLEEIREGIEDGFRQAEKAFGGTLPDISYQTYDAIQEKLKKWAEGFGEAEK